MNQLNGLALGCYQPALEVGMKTIVSSCNPVGHSLTLAFLKAIGDMIGKAEQLVALEKEDDITPGKKKIIFDRGIITIIYFEKNGYGGVGVILLVLG